MITLSNDTRHKIFEAGMRYFETKEVRAYMLGMSDVVPESFFVAPLREGAASEYSGFVIRAYIEQYCLETHLPDSGFCNPRARDIVRCFPLLRNAISASYVDHGRNVYGSRLSSNFVLSSHPVNDLPIEDKLFLSGLIMMGDQSYVVTRGQGRVAVPPRNQGETLVADVCRECREIGYDKDLLTNEQLGLIEGLQKLSSLWVKTKSIYPGDCEDSAVM